MNKKIMLLGAGIFVFAIVCLMAFTPVAATNGASAFVTGGGLAAGGGGGLVG